MLKHLLIRNVALMDELKISFGKGLNVLTGETGAGKSIIVDSVNFLVGGRADKEIIRSGSLKAYVEGEFEINLNDQALSFMRENELEAEEGNVVISREIAQTGRSICRVNGIAVNLNQLKNLCARLIDIHGQHEHQSLLDESNHIGFLDAFGGNNHVLLLASVRQSANLYKDNKKLFDDLLKKYDHQHERKQLLEIQKKELIKANPQAGEEESLRQSLDLLRNAERIRSSLKEAYTAVYDAGNDSNTALLKLQSAAKSMSEIVNYDKEYDNLHQRLESLYYEAEDIGLELRKYINSIDTDENSLHKAAERLDVLKKLSRKYSVPADELPVLLENVIHELDQLGTMDDDLADLEKEVSNALIVYKKFANDLSESRLLTASVLSKKMIQELEEMNMSGTDFIISMTENVSEVRLLGQDNVRLLLAPNQGEEAKPLSRIASGGEISRLMLALKSISAQHNIIPTMVFDEIDTGISGRTAQAVAQKLWNIARFRQVLCVTHLQQIAAMASTQYLIEKKELQGRTYSEIKQLSHQERISEISRIISGFSKDSASSLQHAEHMLKEADHYRNQHQ